MPLPAEPLIGESVDGFEIDHTLGESGSSRLYLARTDDGETAVVCVPLGEHAASERRRERFVRASRIAAELVHPNVVRVLGFGTTSTGLPYVILEHPLGRSLQHSIERDAPLGVGRATRILRELLVAMQHVHDHGYVHCDLNPRNVYLREVRGGEVAQVAGFSRAAERGLAPQRCRARPKGSGSPAFSCPELLEQRAFDHRSDLFSCGVLLYQMLSGQLPFEGSAVAIATQILGRTPPPIADRVPGLEVDHRLEAIACRLMQRVPAERFGSASEVLRVLGELQL